MTKTLLEVLNSVAGLPDNLTSIKTYQNLVLKDLEVLSKVIRSKTFNLPDKEYIITRPNQTGKSIWIQKLNPIEYLFYDFPRQEKEPTMNEHTKSLLQAVVDGKTLQHQYAHLVGSSGKTQSTHLTVWPM